MTTTFNRTQSVLSIAFIEGLERFSYYGTRAIILFYVISQEGLNLSNELALYYYGLFAVVIHLLPLPLGMLTDWKLKQNRAVLLGGGLSVVGYGFILIPQFYSVATGVILLVIGTSLARPNLLVLMGRLYEKEEEQRVFGFITVLTVINIATFIASLLVGYIGATFGWMYGFGLTAFTTLLYTVLFYFADEKLDYREVNLGENQVDTTPVIDQKSSKLSRGLLLALTIGLSVFFWATYDLLSSLLELTFKLKEGSGIFGVEWMNLDILTSLPSVLALGVMLILLLIWYWKGVGSAFAKMGVAMVLLSLATYLIHQLSTIYPTSFETVAVYFILLLALAEAFFLPISISYITRLSDVRYSSTVYGLFLVASYAFAEGIIYLGVDLSSLQLPAIFLITSGIGIGLLVFKRRLIRSAGGVG